MRVVAYEMSFDTVDEQCKIAFYYEKDNSSSIEIIKIEFESEYLRTPNELDLQRVVAVNESQGFRVFGSWDCQHWEWKNCPIGLAGQFKGK